MSDPTTGEWTIPINSVGCVDYDAIRLGFPVKMVEVISMDAHNAALAAKEQNDQELARQDGFKEGYKAAEKNGLVEIGKVSDELQKVAHERDNLSTALAAEREKYVDQREDWIREIQQLKDQLAKVKKGK